MARPILTNAPSGDIVTLAEAKAHCRVDISDEDTLIQAYIDAAVSHLDGYAGILGRCLLEQTWTLGLHDWPNSIRLPFPDVSAVAVTYYDENNDEQTLSGALYEVVTDARGSRVYFKDDFTSPSVYSDSEEPISVAVTAGYGDADDVPQAIKQAILLMVGHLYENRMAVSEGGLAEVPMAFTALTQPFRYGVI